jgi:predicted house-cleaning noncanonical NTP pyrophosphatase (MazG superfamily)
MAKITYNKLVRDRIPEIIHLAGKQCETTVMNEAEYRQGLLDKLVEEAQEAHSAAQGDLATELADILEVVDAILTVHDISVEHVRKVQAARRQEQGGFKKRMKLIWSGSDD